MDHHQLVLPEFLNDQGNLFGGYLLKWIDEFAYITVNLDYPGNRFVTIGLNNVVFKHAIKKGQILRFEVNQTRLGNSSVEYLVQVFGEREVSERNLILFETKITFVNVDEQDQKQTIARTENDS